MRGILINRQKSETWKIQLAIAVNFISSEDVDEEPVMHSKSNNIQLILYDDSNQVVDEIASQFFRNTKLV